MKAPKGKAIVDLGFVKKNYVRDFGGCPECGSDDLEFKKDGAAIGLPCFVVKCKKCGADLGHTTATIKS